MRGDWPLVRLGNHVRKIGSGSTPRGGSGVYLEAGTASLIRSQNVYNDGFRPQGLVYISEAEAARLQGVEVHEGDILLNITGDSVARVCLAPKEYLPARVNQHVAIIRVEPDDFDPRFVRYFIASQSTQERLLALAASGATRNALTKGMLEKLEIPSPPIVEQRGIADVLAVLDDKIMSNSRVTDVLEQIARTVFQCWFVDFLPVQARAAARAEARDPLRAAMCTLSGKDEAALNAMPREQYVQLAATAALFPDELVDSALGQIPSGWEVCRLGTRARTLLGGTPSRSNPEFWGGDIPWINSGKANEFRVMEPSEYITRAGYSRSAAKMLPSRTTIIAITGATLGQVSLTEIETCANQSIVGVVGDPELPGEYLYLWIKQRVTDLIARQTGGAQQHINKNDVNDLLVLIPTSPVIAAFVAVAVPLFDRIRSSCLETQSLAQIRDTLLPKLLSGEIRVQEAQELVEAAA